MNPLVIFRYCFRQAPHTHTHKRRGTRYSVVGVARIQSEYPLNDMESVVIYAGEDGELWARPPAEFHDGRFEYNDRLSRPAFAGVVSERLRQKAVERHSDPDDDGYTDGELARAAAAYALSSAMGVFKCPKWWPWARGTFKRKGKRRDLERAGALILAELERLDRMEARDVA